MKKEKPVPEMNKNSLVLAMHAGSDNHGCEAIAQSLLAQFEETLPENERITLFTHSAEQDKKYIRSRICDVLEEQHIEQDFKAHVAAYVRKRIFRDRGASMRYRFASVLGEGAPELIVSIGGDNYCYRGMIPDLIEADRLFDAQKTKRILLGCSVEPSFLQNNEALREDMKGFERIIARESLTYHALLEAGVPAEKIMQLPDPAFSLKPEFVPLPKIFDEREMIGVNLSPMVQDYALQGNAVFMAYRMLIRHILDSGDEGIALIPHVVWDSSDDRRPLTQLYEEFRDTGRVVMIENRSAAALKACIAACRLFVGARTHATIAAYSSMVPTLVVGYSVKARGIARDLFGSDDNYVLPVQSLTEPELLTQDFDRLKADQDRVHRILREKIPFVIRRAGQNAEAVMEIYRDIKEKKEKAAE